MKVSQAIIGGGGQGSRLKLGNKPTIVYKNKLLLELCIISCLNANINNIIVTIVPEELRTRKQNRMLPKLIRKYPQITFVPDYTDNFRIKPDYVRRFVDERKPFYLLTGHSPQSSNFLKTLSNYYRNGTIAVSGYEYRYDKLAGIATVLKNKIVKYKNYELKWPQTFRSNSSDRFIIESPYILTYDFYDRYIKSNNYAHWTGYYVDRFIKDGGMVYCVENKNMISEIDYKKDLSKLFTAVDTLNIHEHFLRL